MLRKKIKVAVLSNRFLIGEGLKSLVSGRSDYLFVNWITSEKKLDHVVTKTKPDVLIIDTETDFVNDTNSIIHLKQKYRQLNFLIMADHYEATDIRKMIAAGIHVLLFCDCERTEIEGAISAVYNKERFICNRIVDAILTDLEKPKDCGLVNLSDREMEIINSVAEGLSSKEIKEVLHLSVHTINTHKRNIYRKLGINKSSDLIRFAVKNGMMANPG